MQMVQVQNEPRVSCTDTVDLPFSDSSQHILWQPLKDVTKHMKIKHNIQNRRRTVVRKHMCSHPYTRVVAVDMRLLLFPGRISFDHLRHYLSLCYRLVPLPTAQRPRSFLSELFQDTQSGPKPSISFLKHACQSPYNCYYNKVQLTVHHGHPPRRYPLCVNLLATPNTVSLSFFCQFRQLINVPTNKKATPFTDLIRASTTRGTCAYPRHMILPLVPTP